VARQGFAGRSPAGTPRRRHGRRRARGGGAVPARPLRGGGRGAPAGGSGTVTAALVLYGAALRRGTRRDSVPLRLLDSHGTPLPGEGRWRRVLLADGNIGIGGDPVRLLRRCARLLGRDGAVLVELDRPGTPTWRGDVTLADGDRVSAPFPWAFVGVDGLARLA